MLESLRQRLFPPEFRIDAPVWPEDVRAALETLAASALPRRVRSETPASGPPGADSEWRRLVAKIGTDLWRLRQKMIAPGTGGPLEGMRHAYRHVEAMWDALAEAGVEIRDHTGEEIPDGAPDLKMIFQPLPDIASEKVIETIKPTIYHGDRKIQTGEVVVGTPHLPETPEAPETRTVR